MNKALKVLIIEDMKADQELIKRQVLKFAPQSIFTIADDKNSFHEKVKWFFPDIILSDYKLPDFTGLDALLYFKENLPQIPFVFITGELNNEEKVAEAVLYGADGYILKENLQTIPAILEKVIYEKQAQVQKRAIIEEKIKIHRIKLQKAYQLLIKAPNFDNKQTIIEILEELNNTPFEETITIT